MLYHFLWEQVHKYFRLLLWPSLPTSSLPSYSLSLVNLKRKSWYLLTGNSQGHCNLFSWTITNREIDTELILWNAVETYFFPLSDPTDLTGVVTTWFIQHTNSEAFMWKDLHVSLLLPKKKYISKQCIRKPNSFLIIISPRNKTCLLLTGEVWPHQNHRDNGQSVSWVVRQPSMAQRGQLAWGFPENTTSFPLVKLLVSRLHSAYL